MSVSNSLRSDASDGWHRLVGTGDQVGAVNASVDALRLSLGLMRSTASVPETQVSLACVGRGWEGMVSCLVGRWHQMTRRMSAFLHLLMKGSYDLLCSLGSYARFCPELSLWADVLEATTEVGFVPRRRDVGTP